MQNPSTADILRRTILDVQAIPMRARRNQQIVMLCWCIRCCCSRKSRLLNRARIPAEGSARFSLAERHLSQLSPTSPKKLNIHSPPPAAIAGRGLEQTPTEPPNRPLSSIRLPLRHPPQWPPQPQPSNKQPPPLPQRKKNPPPSAA